MQTNNLFGIQYAPIKYYLVAQCLIAMPLLLPHYINCGCIWLCISLLSVAIRSNSNSNSSVFTGSLYFGETLRNGNVFDSCYMWKVYSVTNVFRHDFYSLENWTTNIFLNNITKRKPKTFSPSKTKNPKLNNIVAIYEARGTNEKLVDSTVRQTKCEAYYRYLEKRCQCVTVLWIENADMFSLEWCLECCQIFIQL